MAEIPKGVVAATDIATGTRSKPFTLDHLTRHNEVPKINKPIQAGVWQSGQIRPVSLSLSKGFWPKWIELAADVQEQNVSVRRWQQDTFILQATRPVTSGQKLYLWFAEDLLLHGLGIPPYLSPANIRLNSYVCQNCGHEFQAPNPLKIHLALNCGGLPVDVLWSRLATLAQSPRVDNLSSQSFLSLSPPPPTLNGPFPFPISSLRAPYFAVPPRISHIPPRISHIPPRVTATTCPLRQATSAVGNHFSGTKTSSVGERGTEEAQAQLESMVSNMGKAKNGHVCLYCGKLYSRKYGLKIHIRTHTGYKPLHCRICHRPFGDPSNLNKHVRLHSDANTPYRCDFCGKVLVRRRDLERHIRSRHNNSLSTDNRNVLRQSSRIQNKSAITITSSISSNVNDGAQVDTQHNTLR